MPFESVEPPGPQLPVGPQPGVHLGQRLRLKLVPARLSLRPNADEPGLAQHPQVLRGAGLAEPEALNKVTDGPGLLPKQIENAPPSRLGKDLKSNAHTAYITTQLYSCQGMHRTCGAGAATAVDYRTTERSEEER